MNWNRREFLGALLGAGAFAHAGPVVRPDSLLFEEAPKTGVSILQGMTDETSTQFTLVLPKTQLYTVEVLGASGLPAAFPEPEIVTRDFSPFAVYKIAVDGLQLGQDYRLRVTDARGTVLDERLFRTLDLSPRAVKLAFASCQNDHLSRDDVWRALEAQKPELIFFMGDNVYGDRPGFLSVRLADPEQLWRRYVETRQRLAFYFQKRLTPVLAIWDDHDFGGNNQGRWYPHKEESRLIFETFFAQAPRPRLDCGPGIARRLDAFGADFFLLDGRTFRDGWNLPDSRILGSTQEKWLLPSVRPRPSWLLNGSMFFGAYTGKDSYEGQYAGDFRALLEKLRPTEGLFCFGSGDVHFSEVMGIEADRLGYKTFEMVSSSMHSYTFPGHEWRWRNARRVTATSAHNFTVFEGEFLADRIEGVVSSYSSTGEEFRVPVLAQR